MDNLKTWPEKIYLQIHDEDDEIPSYSEVRGEYNETVTWCEDSVVACEVPYIRADLVAHESLRQQLHTATELITMFGDAVADVFEQMNKANWVDDHGHEVQMNAKMLSLIPIMEKAVMFSKALGEDDD